MTCEYMEMDRIREVRKGNTTASTSGLSRRRARSGGLRDSPDDDCAGELQESGRLRDRPSKKERDRERERERDRDRDRSNRSKRRRADRLLNGNIREEGGVDSSDDSLEEEEEDVEEVVRLPLAFNHASSSSSYALNHQKKGIPSKIVRATTAWKGDEMIGLSVPRKARSASVKRSHECWISGGGIGASVGDPIIRQASISPARPAASTAAMSPSSSCASVRKKMKPSNSKQRPSKVCKSSSSSIQEIEIEVAEVLYEMTRQFHCSTKPELATVKDGNGLSNDARSISSPSSISHPVTCSQGTSFQQNSTPNTASTVSAAKKKKPRPGREEEEHCLIFQSQYASAIPSVTIEEQVDEIKSPVVDMVGNRATDNLECCSGQEARQTIVASSTPINNVKSENYLPPDTQAGEALNGPKQIKTDEITIVTTAPEYPAVMADVDLEDGTNKMQSTTVVMENGRDEKLNIDLMVVPDKLSPERETVPCYTVTAKMEEATITEVVDKKEEKPHERLKTGLEIVNSEGKDTLAVEEVDSQKQSCKEEISEARFVSEEDKDLKVDLLQQTSAQLPKVSKNETKLELSAAQSSQIPLPTRMGSWPGDPPGLGYMAHVPSLHSVGSVDGTSSITPLQLPHPHFFLQHSRIKRCATHFYIAQSIFYHQQISRASTFWPGGSGPAAFYGNKQYNLNVLPPSESALLGLPLQENMCRNNVTSSFHDKGNASIPAHVAKEKNLQSGVAVPPFVEASQIKLLPHGAQRGPANNSLLTPAFIFPLNQHHAAVAAGSNVSKSAISSTSATMSVNVANAVSGAGGSIPSATMSFSCTPAPSNEAQYLAILQGNAYPFPVPPPVSYRGSNHNQAVPFFSGSLYPSQMLNASHLQQSSVHIHTIPGQSSATQNTSTSSGSSSSQKQGTCSNNGGLASSQNFPSAKHKASSEHLIRHQPHQLEADNGGEESPSTADSRFSHCHRNASVVYGNNFAMPTHQNFAMVPSALSGLNGMEKHSSSQQNGRSAAGVDATPQGYGVSFASTSLDFAGMPVHPAVFHGFSEAARQNYQLVSAANAQTLLQPKKGPAAEEGKSDAGEPSNQKPPAEEGKKNTSASIVHAVAFSKSEAGDQSASLIMGSNTVDGSRSLPLIPASGGPVSTNCATVTSGAVALSTFALSNVQHQHQHNALQQLQRQQQQQQYQQLAARTKFTSTTNGSAYNDGLSALSKLPTSLPNFSQNFLHGSNGTQSSQWKFPTRPTSAQVPSSPASVKGHSQQQGRTQQQNSAQISFGSSPKSPAQQQFSANSPASSAAGSPSTRSAGGSPKRNNVSGKSGPLGTSTGSAILPSQLMKSSTSSSSRRSPPVSNSRNIASAMSNSNVSTPKSVSKAEPIQNPQTNHVTQQKSQAQPFHQAQLFFSNAYMHVPSTQSMSTGSAVSAYHQRRPLTEQQPQSQHQNPSISGACSSGVLSLCSPSLTLSGGGTSDPTKAVAAAQAAAAANFKGLNPASLLHAAQFGAPPGGSHPLAFPYLHAMPAVPVNSSEQKTANGNDRLHQCWQHEKR